MHWGDNLAEIIQLDNSADRTATAKAAGDEFVADLERIINDLNVSDGTSLGDMVKSNLEMVESETKYNVKTGIPNKASKTVNDAAQRIKQAGG